MRSTRSRLAAGLCLALVAGVIGPVSTALSMSSRTYLDMSGPLPGPSEPPVLFETYLNSQRGVAGRLDLHEGGWFGTLTFISALGHNSRAAVSPSAYSARAGDDARTYMTFEQCTWYDDCKSRTWSGDEGLSWDGRANNAEFRGVLRDEAGRACTVEATWVARSGPNVTYDPDIHPVVHGRTSRPAWFYIDASCGALGGADDGEIWTDHIVETGSGL